MFKKTIISTALLALSANVNAGVISKFDSWTDMTLDDPYYQTGTYTDGKEDRENGEFVANPGVGGQQFDAEYLFYKLDGTTLSIGLQTGFNVESGYLRYGNYDYWAGDLALSFDNDATKYEFAADFGLITKTYWQDIIEVDDDLDSGGDFDGKDPAGLYEVDEWDNRIYYDESAPYAITDGTLIQGIGTGFNTDAAMVGDSYWRTVSFDISSISAFDINNLDAHWTMSCGNDAVNGSVPEPSSLLLLSAGFIGLMGSLVARRKRKTS